MTQTMQVRCSGPEHQPHAPVTFEFNLEQHLDGFAVQEACPFCALQKKINALDSTIQDVWKKNRQANDTIATLMEMREWWVKTCAVDNALKEEVNDETPTNQQGNQ